MIDSSNFKKGDCVTHKGAPMEIVDVTFSTPTARGAGVIVKTKLRNLVTGQVLNESFRTGEKFEEVDVETHPCSFMYADGTHWHFMDDQTYEQFQLDRPALGDAVDYLKDGVEGMRATLIQGRIVRITLPTTVDLVVTETEPAIKGASAQALLKSAVLETGLRIQVPPYLTAGETVRVDTRDGRFVERVR